MPADISNDENRSLPTLPLLLSDSETLDEGFETQSNVSETVEPTPRSCPIEIISNETNEINSTPIDETLADELTQRLTFTTTRRLSHDSSIRQNNNKRTSHSNGRSTSLLKSSSSAYSYPTFNSIGQKNQQNNTFAKRTPSAESLRLTSTNNNAVLAIRSSRHIQRCAVSRRIWNEKDTDESSKTLTTSPPSSSPVSALQISIEPDEVSSSSTATTTTTTMTTTTVTTNRRLSSTKSKNKIRNLHSLTDTSSSCSNSPIIRKIPSRLGHASSCQNVSTASTTNNSKSSSLMKTRSPPSFFLNSSQLLRSTFSRPTEKPLRAFHMSTTINNESSSPRTRRLFSSNNDIDSTSISSPKNLRKPPSSWHHQKSLTNKTSLTNLTAHRKSSTSTIDLRKTNLTNNNVFQRLTQSKRI